MNNDHKTWQKIASEQTFESFKPQGRFLTEKEKRYIVVGFWIASVVSINRPPLSVHAPVLEKI